MCHVPVLESDPCWGSGSFELEIKILPRHLLFASWNRETGWGTMTRFSGLRCNPKLRYSKGIAGVIYRQFWEARTVPRWRQGDQEGL